MSSSSASAQRPPWSAPVRERGRQRSARRRRPCPRARPDDRPAQLRVVAAGHDEQRDLAEAHDARRRRRTAGASRRTPRARTARPRAGPPSPRRSRSGPRPPRGPRRWSARRSRPSDHHITPRTSRPLAEALPGRLVGHQRGALGQREHEDQVEEQLERRHASPRDRSTALSAVALRAEAVLISVIFPRGRWVPWRYAPRDTGLPQTDAQFDFGRAPAPAGAGAHRRRGCGASRAT